MDNNNLESLIKKYSHKLDRCKKELISSDISFELNYLKGKVAVLEDILDDLNNLLEDDLKHKEDIDISKTLEKHNHWIVYTTLKSKLI